MGSLDRDTPWDRPSISRLTSANHWGHFELKLCPTNGKKRLATQECFDKHPLVLAENPRTHQFYVPLDSPKITKFNYQVQLPYGLTCSQCVMQWTYYTGNTWVPHPIPSVPFLQVP